MSASRRGDVDKVDKKTGLPKDAIPRRDMEKAREKRLTPSRAPAAQPKQVPPRG